MFARATGQVPLERAGVALQSVACLVQYFYDITINWTGVLWPSYNVRISGILLEDWACCEEMLRLDLPPSDLTRGS